MTTPEQIAFFNERGSYVIRHTREGSLRVGIVDAWILLGDAADGDGFWLGFLNVGWLEGQQYTHVIRVVSTKQTLDDWVITAEDATYTVTALDEPRDLEIWREWQTWKAASSLEYNQARVNVLDDLRRRIR